MLRTTLTSVGDANNVEDNVDIFGDLNNVEDNVDIVCEI